MPEDRECAILVALGYPAERRSSRSRVRTDGISTTSSTASAGSAAGEGPPEE
jgi:hypothetical protein